MMLSLLLAAVFSANFGEYTQGEALSNKGAQGGAWNESALEAGATSDGAGGMAISTAVGASLDFVASPGTTDTLSRVEFRLKVDTLSLGSPDDLDAIAGIVPATLDDGTLGFYGWGDGVWHTLTGVAPTTNAWIEGCVETRVNDGMLFVRYSVKDDGDYVTLQTKNNRTWFRAGYDTNGVSQVCFTGVGAFGNFGADEEHTNELAVAKWKGGDSGKWSKAKNWKDGVAPASGELARIDGTVTLKDDDDKEVQVKDFVGYVKDDGTVEMLGGVYRPGIAIDDMTRPRAGKKLTVNTVDILGLKGEYDYIWYQADYTKNYNSVVSQAATMTPTSDDYESWYRVNAYDALGVAARQDFYFSKLPVCYLTTDDGTEPTANKEEHTGTIRVQGNDEYKQQYDGAMTIKVRGNSTAGYPKKPYKIKLDKKTNLFEFGKQKHWVLLANYNDPCEFRNKFASDFANDIGGLGMNSEWVNCVLNGTFLGCYQFCEHIRVDENRVNVYNWEDAAGKVAEKFQEKHGLSDDQLDELTTQMENDYTWVVDDSVTYVTNGVALTEKPSKLWKKFSNDISGGYIFEFSEDDESYRFTTKAGKLEMITVFNAPEVVNTAKNMTKGNKAMNDWGQNYLSNYWNAVVSPDRKCGGKYYWDYCDIDSMVNFFLVNELFSNYDALKKSRYASIDQGGKLVWGPVWDFDYGSMSIVVSSGNLKQTHDRWEVSAARPNDKENVQRVVLYSMFKEWSSDWYFCWKLRHKYWKIRDKYWDIMKDGGKIDQGVAYLKEAYVPNDVKWQRGRTGEADAKILKEFLQARIAWLDEQFATTHSLIQSLKTAAEYTESGATKSIQTSPWDGIDRFIPTLFFIQ